MKRAFWFIAFLLMISTGITYAEDRREFDWQYTLSPGGTISLENVDGDVTLKAGSGNEVKIHAIKTGRLENFDRVEIRIDAGKDAIRIETVYPKWKNNTNVSVEYDLVVPRDAVLDAIQTVNGDVTIHGVFGPIHSKTVNGTIEIRGVQAEVEAQTVNGDMDVAMMQLPTTATVDLESVNGTIQLGLPANAQADVSAELLNGSMKSDFPLNISGIFGSKKMSGKIGGGGAKIQMDSVNGGILILRSEP